MTGKYVLDRERARASIRENVRRVHEFYRRHPVRPCPRCGADSRIADPDRPASVCITCLLGPPPPLPQ